ncbi:hypothetical protein HZ326_19391 [Fusarium oxysporum f. sp. albedinis]|nr:hypothetical protein HZ326_19391 [Fusarium oxysporum f. sp. albedinis]
MGNLKSHEEQGLETWPRVDSSVESKHALAYQTLPLALIKLDLFMGGFSVECRVWHPMPFSIIMGKLPSQSKASTLFYLLGLRLFTLTFP